jgi:predicted N-acetyltransferase YhbS
MRIREMTDPDLDFAADCTSREGWTSETRYEFESFLAHDPHGCFVAEEQGTRIGMCVATPYGAAGFVGLLIVSAPHRNRGVGRGLVEHAIAYLSAQGAESVFLDGVPQAVPLYERLGFRKVCRSLRLVGTVRGTADSDVTPMVRQDLHEVRLLDREAFGADRSTFLRRRLESYPDLCRVLWRGREMAGFIMGRRTAQMVSVGPWVMRPGAARPEALLPSVTAPTEALTVHIGTLETSTASMALLYALGFVPREDPPWRMVRGPWHDLASSPRLFAIGSPAKG